MSHFARQKNGELENPETWGHKKDFQATFELFLVKFSSWWNSDAAFVIAHNTQEKKVENGPYSVFSNDAHSVSDFFQNGTCQKRIWVKDKNAFLANFGEFFVNVFRIFNQFWEHLIDFWLFLISFVQIQLSKLSNQL